MIYQENWHKVQDLQGALCSPPQGSLSHKCWKKVIANQICDCFFQYSKSQGSRGGLHGTPHNSWTLIQSSLSKNNPFAPASNGIPGITSLSLPPSLQSLVLEILLPRSLRTPGILLKYGVSLFFVSVSYTPTCTHCLYESKFLLTVLFSTLPA